MVEHEIVPQMEYSTIEEFAEMQNNFYMHFLDDCLVGNMYRTRAPFVRFQKLNPEVESKVTRKVVDNLRNNPREKLPYQELFEAYKIMSKLVFIDDEHVVRGDSKPDTWFLCR